MVKRAINRSDVNNRQLIHKMIRIISIDVCNLCNRIEGRISHLKNFSSCFVIDGNGEEAHHGT